jgi:hypothetical protein
MPLQIRRGTDAERRAMAQPLAQGELLYVTDDQRLYIGNGSTLGGLQITGYRDEDAQDAAAAMITSGIHTGINFVYNDADNRINATVDLSNYAGVIRADAFKGSVFADDGSTIGGTLLVDAVAGSINLSGTVKGNIIPDTNIAYDLGSASRRFRDLYLSGSSIKLGDATITASGSAVNLPVGSTINGVPLATLGEMSIIADITGSVFGDDSSILVDAVSNIISTGTVGLSLSGSSITSTDILSPLTIESERSGNEAVEIKMLGDGTAQGPTLVISVSNGSLINPDDHAAGDEISSIQFKGHAGGIFKEAVSIASFWSSTADMNSATPDSNLLFAVRNNVDGFKVFRFNERGVLTAPVFKATGYATGSLPSSPEEGWIAFDSTTKQFKGWNGTAWAVLG